MAERPQLYTCDSKGYIRADNSGDLTELFKWTLEDHQQGLMLERLKQHRCLLGEEEASFFSRLVVADATGIQLDNNSIFLGSPNPRHNFPLTMLLREAPGATDASPVELEVVLLSGKSLATLHICTYAMVADVKRLLLDAAGVPTWMQQIMADGVILEDAKRLNQYNLFKEGKGQITLMKTGAFAPPEAFTGEPELGYIFKNGEQGLGYYKDEYEDCFWKTGGASRA